MDSDDVPQVDSLDADSPEYVVDLEQGLIKLDDDLKEQVGYLRNLVDTIYTQLYMRLQGKGVDLAPIEEILQKKCYKAHYADLLEILHEGVGLRTHSPQAEKLLQQTTREINRFFNHRGSTISSAVVGLHNRRREYEIAIMGLTEAEAVVNEGSPDTLYTFILRREGVFEAHVDIATGTTKGPKINPQLCRLYLEDPHFLRSLKREGVQAAYKIRNPSEIMTLAALTQYGVGLCLEDITRNLIQRATGMGALTQGLDTIKA